MRMGKKKLTRTATKAANEDLAQKSDGLCLGEDDSQKDTKANTDGNPLD